MAIATITVPVKSAWSSKINWLSIGSAAASLLTTNAFGLDAKTQVAVMTGLQLAQSLGTVILRTWFSPSVTPGSVS